jgi:hypothetical protein
LSTILFEMEGKEMENRITTGLRITFWVHLIVGGVLGLAYLLVPETVGNLANWPIESPWPYRLIGAAIIGYAASSLFALLQNVYERVRIIVETEIVWTVLAALVLVWGALAGNLPWLAWVFAAIMLAFTVAFTAFLVEEERMVRTHPHPVKS